MPTQALVGGPCEPPTCCRVELLPFVRLDHFLDFGLDGLQVEGSWILHRRIVDGRHGELAHCLLNDDEAPELARIEVIHVASTHIIQTLAANGRRAFEGILAQIHDRRHVGGDFLTGPAPRLLDELKLEVIDANGTELRSTEVEELMARGWTGPVQERHLVIPIEMVFVRAVTELHALQELVGDIGIAGSGQKRWEPVETREDTVLDGAGLDVSGPADDGGNTEAAFENGALRGAERSHAAIGPGETLRRRCRW